MKSFLAFPPLPSPSLPRIPPPPPPPLSRRKALLTGILLPLTTQPLLARADDLGSFPIPQDSAELEGIRQAVFSVSGVRPALTARQYVEAIVRSRGPSVDLVINALDRGRYADLSLKLVLSPFDDLRQACFYLPWALLEDDDIRAGIRSQIAYNTLLEQIKAFDRNLQNAARLLVDDDVVYESWALVLASLDTFWNSIPAKYKAGLSLKAAS